MPKDEKGGKPPDMNSPPDFSGPVDDDEVLGSENGPGPEKVLEGAPGSAPLEAVGPVDDEPPGPLKGEAFGVKVEGLPQRVEPGAGDVFGESAQGGVPYRRLFRWGWFIVSAVFGWFALNTLLTILVLVLSQYKIHVLAVVISGLGGEGSAAKEGATGFAGLLEQITPAQLEWAAILFSVLVVLVIAAKLGNSIMEAWTNNNMLGRLQQTLHDKLITLGPVFHEKHKLGETMLVVTQFSAGTQQLLRELISFPLVNGITLITALFFLSASMDSIGQSPTWLKYTLLAALIIMPVGGWHLSNRLRAAYEKVRNSEMELANEFSNSGTLPVEVQLMGAEEQRSQAFAVRIKNLIVDKVRASVKNAVANQFQETTPEFLQAVFLIYGVFFAVKSGGPEAAGGILGIFYFVPQVVSPIQDIISFVTGLNTTWPQVEKVVEILEAEPEVKFKPKAKNLDPSARSLTFENVTFAYAPGAPLILDGLTHEFNPGQVTAVVAPSGGGKSSLLNLVARLRDPNEGRILIGGLDIREASKDSLRRNVVKVSQFPLFIVDTIRANFKLAKADATDQELEEVCRKTGLWTVLEDHAPPGRSPLDYELPASEGLSGGQRRLLAVTRALLLDPSILLLDEPTTGVDMAGRQMLVRVLREACVGVTVLLVDHDMEFVARISDQVCCLEDGIFTSSGPPDELAQGTNLFQSLLQAHERVMAEPEFEVTSFPAHPDDYE